MIRPAREEELDLVCDEIAKISPWTVLGILGAELRQGLRVDPLKSVLVYEDDSPGNHADGTALRGAVIYRVCHAAELLFFRGFGEALALRHGVDFPCEWSDIPDAGYVGSLAVFGNQTGRGIGPQLLSAVHGAVAENGSVLTYLTVSDFNRRARQFYEREGFEWIGSLDNCLRAGNREHLLEKRHG